MYVLLLAIGTAIAAAGLAIVGASVSFEAHTFDPTVVTPGVVAIVGGLILVALAFVFQQLKNIEKAVLRANVAPVQRKPLPDLVVAEPVTESSLPVPPEVVVPSEEVPPLPAVATVRPAVQEAERLREKFPSLLRVDDASQDTRQAEESNVSVLPKPPVHLEEQADETRNVAVARQIGGVASGRAAPRLVGGLGGRSDRIRDFDSFWPKRKRPAEVAPVPIPAAAAEEQAEPPALVEVAQPPAAAVDVAPEPVIVAPELPEPVPVTVLKSGVVDGMAYTLYSDGSIEAQLPQGTLRFGSITELRNHIEQSA